jgi:hypothetical protein
VYKLRALDLLSVGIGRRIELGGANNVVSDACAGTGAISDRIHSVPGTLSHHTHHRNRNQPGSQLRLRRHSQQAPSLASARMYQ